MVAIHLSNALGGELLMGFISAVAFATILAVVAGLTLAGSTAICHDLYAKVVLKGVQNEKKKCSPLKLPPWALVLWPLAWALFLRNKTWPSWWA